MSIVSLDEITQKAADLPVISPAIIEIINIIDDPTVPIADIVSLVEVDEVLCADIFRFANSATFGSRRKVTTLNDAIMLIGLMELKQIAFLIAAKKVISDNDLWYHSVFVATAAKEIAKKLNKSHVYVEQLYMAGLMHAFGALVFNLFYKKEYGEVKKLDCKQKRLIQEKETFGIDHVDLNYHILKTWGLPSKVLEIIRNHQKNDNEDYSEQNLLIELADKLEKFEYADESDLELLVDPVELERYGLEKLRLTPKMVKDFHKKAQELINF